MITNIFFLLKTCKKKILILLSYKLKINEFLPSLARIVKREESNRGKNFIIKRTKNNKDTYLTLHKAKNA